MAVQRSTSTDAKSPAPAPSAQEADAAQSIALKLFRVKRYMRVGDNRVYESGVVYTFDALSAHRLLRERDPAGFPVFTIHDDGDAGNEAAAAPARAKPQPRQKAPAPQVVVEAPVAVLTAEPLAEKRIEIPDDDPELKARLENIDSGSDGAVAV